MDIWNLVTRGLGKRTPNLTTQSYMIKRSTPITRRGEEHAFTALIFRHSSLCVMVSILAVSKVKASTSMLPSAFLEGVLSLGIRHPFYLLVLLEERATLWVRRTYLPLSLEHHTFLWVKANYIPISLEQHTFLHVRRTYIRAPLKL